jgi:uncharacterized membrane protein
MILALLEPNLHPTLVHYPIALLTLGVVIELFAGLWRRSGVRTAGHWMIVLGTLASIPAITTGLYALRQTVNPAANPTDPWYQIAQTSPWSAKQWAVLAEHVRFTAAAGIILLICIATWLGSSDRARPRIYLLGVAILLLCLYLIAQGAHAGGELVYEHATGVRLPQREQPIAETVVPEESSNAWIDPTELHLLLAGLSVAIVVMTVGLTVRRSAIAWENQMAETKATAAGLKPAGQNFLGMPVVYPGRFWVVGGVLAAATALTGIWILGLWNPGPFYDYLQRKQENDEWRAVLHAIFAISILALIVLLGVQSRWFPRRRFLMGILTTLLVIAISVQAWTGVLMLFDSTTGPVTRFNRPPKPLALPAAATTSEAAPATAPVLAPAPAAAASPATVPAQ